MANLLTTITLSTSSTSGTLTSSQLTTLQESKTNYILYGDELFKLANINSSTLTYTCLDLSSGYFIVKSIVVTISTGAWVLSSNTIAQYTLNGTDLDITTAQ